MLDLELALAELSAAVGAQNFALGQMLELLATNGSIDRLALLARLRERSEGADLSDLQRHGLRDLVESIRKADDPQMAPVLVNREVAGVISLDRARQRRGRPRSSGPHSKPA
jgi:hypothetical protein